MVGKETELGFVESPVSSGAKPSSGIGVEAVDLEGGAISRQVGDEGTLGRCDFVATGKMVCRALSWLPGTEMAASDGSCWIRSMTVAHGFCRAPAFGRRGVGDAAVGWELGRYLVPLTALLEEAAPRQYYLAHFFSFTEFRWSAGNIKTPSISHSSHNKAGWRKGIRRTIHYPSANLLCR